MGFNFGGAASGAEQGASYGAMTGNPYVAGGAAILGGIKGALSAKASNKRNPQPVMYQPYSGYRPPAIDYAGHNNLRDVQQTITDTLMRRSQGQDVGYDPRLIAEANQGFDATQAQQADRAKEDINNELSGTGQSRNLAARAQTLGRFNTDQQRQKTQFMTGVDIANMERANQEKQTATAGLQGLNSFDFGQEDRRADFDLSVYNDENAAKVGAFNTQNTNFQNYQDPAGNAVQSAGDVAGGVSNYNANNSMSGYLQQLAKNYQIQNTDLINKQKQQNVTPDKTKNLG